MYNDINKKIKIVIFGCGNMGEAILSTWLEEGVKKENIYIIDPNPSNWLLNQKKYGLNLNQVFPKKAEICLIAVKPQIINSVIKDLKKFDVNKTIFLSIVAGKKFEFFEEKINSNVKLVRAMPNTPAKIKKSITSLISNRNVEEKDFVLANNLFNLIGETINIKNEEFFDIITAISGSGPAYIFYILESFIELQKNLLLKL